MGYFLSTILFLVCSSALAQNIAPHKQQNCGPQNNNIQDCRRITAFTLDSSRIEKNGQRLNETPKEYPTEKFRNPVSIEGDNFRLESTGKKTKFELRW